MATATATHARSHSPSNGPAFRAHPAPRPPDPPPKPSSQPSQYAAEVERDEAWVQQLQEEQNERFNTQANILYKEHLAELENAGPFATHETRNSLRAQYDERLKQMRDMQQEELEQHIERERQERLWSLGLEDDHWEGWNSVIQDQAAIYANIKRAATVEAEASIRERIRENAREVEDLGRHSEEWQSTEHQRVVDRARWAERQRASNINVGQRRQRDYAEAESQAAQARAREAHLRETLGAFSDSTPSSRPDSVFSAAASSIDTPPSSVHSERWRPTPSPSIAIPIPGNEARRSYNGDRASPVDDVRRASPARPSPLSGTPTTSHTMAHAKAEERPTVWIPPEGTRLPGRKGSIFFDGHEPTRKPSGGFDAREPARKASGVFDSREPARKTSGVFDGPEPTRKASGQFSPQEESVRRTYQSSPSPQPPSHQPPNAPSLRNAPLPTAQPIYTPPPQPVPQQPQPQPYQPPPQPTRQASQSRPSAPPPAAPSRPSAPPPTTQPRRQDSSTPPRTAPPTQPTTSYTNPRPTASPTTARPAPAPTTRPAPAPTPYRPAPAATHPKGPPPPATDPADDRRRQLREEFVGGQKERKEAEDRRRAEEENIRRAEEARQRGADKRRAEEQAREAERRESERKEAERRLRAGLPKAGPVKAVDMAEVWAAYESQWAAMASAGQLRFRSIPWPVPTPVLEPASLLPIQIAAFVLSPAHSQAKSRKDRLREALLRWHPDRFEAKWLRKVVEEERESVKEGVGLVVRALNELLSVEGTFAA